MIHPPAGLDQNTIVQQMEYHQGLCYPEPRIIIHNPCYYYAMRLNEVVARDCTIYKFYILADTCTEKRITPPPNYIEAHPKVATVIRPPVDEAEILPHVQDQ